MTLLSRKAIFLISSRHCKRNKGKSMYTVIKRMEISAAHRLCLSYRSKCEQLHGHNWVITVYCRSKELNAEGMVVDFSHVKQAVKSKLDHQVLNEVLPSDSWTSTLKQQGICSQTQRAIFSAVGLKGNTSFRT